MEETIELINYYVFGYDVIDKEVQIYKVSLSESESKNVVDVGKLVCYNSFVEYEGYLEEKGTTNEDLEKTMKEIFKKY